MEKRKGKGMKEGERDVGGEQKMVETPDCACAGLCFFFVGLFLALCIYSITKSEDFFAILCGVCTVLAFGLGLTNFMETKKRKGEEA